MSQFRDLDGPSRRQADRFHLGRGSGKRSDSLDLRFWMRAVQGKPADARPSETGLDQSSPSTPGRKPLLSCSRVGGQHAFHAPNAHWRPP